MAAFPWEINCVVCCRGTGAGGQVMGESEFEYVKAAVGGESGVAMKNSGPLALDFSQSQGVDLTAQWESAVGPEFIVLTNLVMELI